MTLLNRTAPDLRVRMTIVYAIAGWLVALTSLNSPAVAGTTAKCPYVVKKEDIGSPEKTREYVFHLSGAFPQVYLAALYNRLAQCAPDALKPQRYDIERSQIFTTAFDNNILPGGERSILPKDFEDATLALSRYVIRRAPDLESSPSMFFLPGVKPVVEDHYFKQILTDAKGINDPSRVSQRTLDTICKTIGHEAQCVTPGDVKTVGPDSRQKTYAVLPHYRIDITVTLPAEQGRIVANDALRFILKQNPGLRNDPANLPTFDPVAAKAQSIPASAQCDAQAVDAKTVFESLGLANPYTGTGSSVLVVEQSAPKPNEVVKLAQINHPYYKPGILQGYNLLNPTLPAPDADTGHALHVAHIIGAQGTADGWTGIASHAPVSITDFSYFMNTTMNRRQAAIASDPTGSTPPDYNVVNLSMMLGRADCSPDESSNNYYARFKQGVLDEGVLGGRPNAATLYIIAASSKLPQCTYNARNPVNLQEDCHDLACIGRYDLGIAVAPLAADQTSIRDETRLDDSGLMIAAPGTNILSADDDPASGQLGLRLRCGSSQATPMVAALASAVVAKYQLSPAVAKERIYAASAMLPQFAALPGRSMRVAGKIDIDKTLGSPPDQDVIWTTDMSGSAPVAQKHVGKVVFFDGKFQLVPAVQARRPIHGGGVAPSELVAVKRIKTVNGTGPVQFRNLYRLSTEAYTKLMMGTSYDLQKDDHGDTLCSLTPSANDRYPPCIKIVADTGAETPIDATTVDSIIFSSTPRN